MKKLAALLGVTVALALVPAQGASAGLTAGVFPEDEFAALSSSDYPFAVGGGTAVPLFVPPRDQHFAFSAHLGPAGPSGYAVVSDPALGEVQGPVVCFNNLGPQEASFGIVVKKASGTLAGFQFFTFYVLDNGEPSGDPPDLFALIAVDNPCGDVVVVLTVGRVTQGNIVVKD